MQYNTYQPPANFQPSFPQQQHPQLAPMTYGQAPMNPAQAGVNLENASHKLLLKNYLQAKEAALGFWGIISRIWFLLVILSGMVVIIVAAMSFLLEYSYSGKQKLKFALLCLFWVWLVVQSILTIVNVGSKDAVRANNLWLSMIFFAILYLLAIIWARDPQYDAIQPIIAFLYVPPVSGSLIFTAILKNLLEKREELVQKLAALSTINP